MQAQQTAALLQLAQQMAEQIQAVAGNSQMTANVPELAY